MKSNLIIHLLVYILIVLILSVIAYTNITILLLTEMLNLRVNYPLEVQQFIKKICLYLFLFSTVIFTFLVLGKNNKISLVKSYIEVILNKVEKLLKLKYFVLFCLIYLIALFYIAINNYDLGFDEAWYLNYALNFVKTGFPFYTIDDNLAIISIADMLPNFIIFSIYASLSSITLVDVKIISSIISIAGLILVFYSIDKNSSRTVSILSMIFIVLQLGFGFVASSFFGEIIALGFLFIGIHLLFNQNRLLWASLFLSLSIHTKLQLLPLVIAAFIICSLIWQEKKILKILLIIIIFVGTISLVRIIPVILYEPKFLLDILKQYYFLSSYHNSGISIFTIERLQLYNRLFPLSILIIISFLSFPALRTKFEKFIYVFAVLMNLYWIFFFSFVTYRHLFLGIVPLCFLTALFLNHYYTALKKSLTLLELRNLKYIMSVGLILFFLYGASSNLIYAYIGYNDGVQFDLDGYKSRLFTDIKYDGSQAEFYKKVKEIVDENDIIYTQSPHLTRFYLNNKNYTLDKIKLDINNGSKKYIIISREAFPGEVQKGFQALINEGISYKEVLNTGEFYLLTVI